jgi:uncharacterized protein YoxC
MAKKEVLSDYKRNKKRKMLIELANDLNDNIQYNEYNLQSVIEQIKEFSPTRKELKDGLQDLIDCYG